MAYQNPTPPTSSTLSIEDGKGEEVPVPGAEPDQVVIATDSEGNSLTLSEEFAARRKRSVPPLEIALSFACATASLAFATLIYFNTQ